MPTNVSELKSQKASSLSRFAAAINDSNLIAIALFCAIGLLVTAIVMVHFPDFGALTAQYNQF
jgi:hypothetical protein